MVCFKIYFEESVYMIYRMNRNYKRRGFLRIMFWFGLSNGVHKVFVLIEMRVLYKDFKENM